MTIADRIRIKREEMQITQEELAARCGYAGKSSICKIEQSGDNITLKKIQRVAEALGVSRGYLMGWEDEAPVSPDPAKVEEAMKLYEQFSRLTPEYKKTLLNMLEVGRIAADLHLTERDKKQ